MSVRGLDRILLVVCEGVTVNGLQGVVACPSSPLLNVCVADSSCMEGADHVVPVIMDADMGQAVAASGSDWQCTDVSPHTGQTHMSSGPL